MVAADVQGSAVTGTAPDDVWLDTQHFEAPHGAIASRKASSTYGPDRARARRGMGCRHRSVTIRSMAYGTMAIMRFDGARWKQIGQPLRGVCLFARARARRGLGLRLRARVSLRRYGVGRTAGRTIAGLLAASGGRARSGRNHAAPQRRRLLAGARAHGLRSSLQRESEPGLLPRRSKVACSISMAPRGPARARCLRVDARAGGVWPLPDDALGRRCQAGLGHRARPTCFGCAPKSGRSTRGRDRRAGTLRWHGVARGPPWILPRHHRFGRRQRLDRR